MELASLCLEVCNLVQRIGKEILIERTKFNESSIEIKGLNDLVSYVDKEAEQKLVAGLKNLLPEADFITEEGTEGISDFENLDSEKLYWIIDPLDGTTNFIHNLPIFAVSVALWRQDGLLIGVVYEPNRDECFYAWKNGGTWLKDKQLRVDHSKKLQASLLATGFPYFDFVKVENYLSAVKEFMQKSHGLRRMGSAAVDLAYVAAGRFEGFFEYNLKPWDVAGGALLVLEAGGSVSDFSGNQNFLFGKEIIAAGGAYSEIVEVIQRNW